MEVNNIVYLSELAVILFVIIIGVIIIKLKHKKWILRFLGICTAVAIIIGGTTFIVQSYSQPYADAYNNQVSVVTEGNSDSKVDTNKQVTKAEAADETNKQNAKAEAADETNKQDAKAESADEKNKQDAKEESTDETNGKDEIAINVDDNKEKNENTQPATPKQEDKTTVNTNQSKGVIYLTFDDGPSSQITPKVLDILKEKDVKATFFILNYNSEGEKLVQREYAEGHTVAIHGYSHDYKTIYQSEDIFMENVTKLQEKIKASTGYNATIIRFPGGSSNMVSKYNPGIMTRLTKLVLEKGYRYFDWNVSSGDAGGASTSDELYENVVNSLGKSKNNVVLMHDFGSNSKLLDALPRIIDYGKENGYTFERITESTPMVTHRVGN